MAAGPSGLVAAIVPDGDGMAVLDLTAENADAVLASSDTLLIDFWAPWCPPCRAFAPVFERAATDNPDIVFARADTHEETELKAAFGIESIPTLVAIRDRVIVAEQPGAIKEDVLSDVIRQVRALDMEDVQRSMNAEGAES